MTSQLFVMLDNVRSAYNVGSVFRTCDSAGVDELYLTGYTCHPPHHKLQKTALGATKSVSWEHHCDPVRLVKYLKSQSIKIISLETVPQATSLYKYSISSDTCLIFGHEEKGINPEVLALSDSILSIPHFGIKESLNIATAAGVAIYEIKRQLEFT